MKSWNGTSSRRASPKRALWCANPNPTPHTPHPTPHTPHPTPHTPHPTPQTPNPKPQTPHPNKPNPNKQTNSNKSNQNRCAGGRRWVWRASSPPPPSTGAPQSHPTIQIPSAPKHSNQTKSDIQIKSNRTQVGQRDGGSAAAMPLQLLLRPRRVSSLFPAPYLSAAYTLRPNPKTLIPRIPGLGYRACETQIKSNQTQVFHAALVPPRGDGRPPRALHPAGTIPTSHTLNPKPSTLNTEP